jgi:hypothetical protein
MVASNKPSPRFEATAAKSFGLILKLPNVFASNIMLPKTVGFIFIFGFIALFGSTTIAILLIKTFASAGLLKPEIAILIPFKFGLNWIGTGIFVIIPRLTARLIPGILLIF